MHSPLRLPSMEESLEWFDVVFAGGNPNRLQTEPPEHRVSRFRFGLHHHFGRPGDVGDWNCRSKPTSRTRRREAATVRRWGAALSRGSEITIGMTSCFRRVTRNSLLEVGVLKIADQKHNRST